MAFFGDAVSLCIAALVCGVSSTKEANKKSRISCSTGLCHPYDPVSAYSFFTIRMYLSCVINPGNSSNNISRDTL